MEPEPKRPGGPAGVHRLLPDMFGVSPTPSIGIEEAIRRARAAARAQGVPFERAYVSDQPVRRGTLFDAAGRRVKFPQGCSFDRCYVVLLDPQPTARWGHDAHWAFVPADGELHDDVVLDPTKLPAAASGLVRFLPFPGEE